MHIYAFGSLCRGEVDIGSDIDLLAISNDKNKRFDPNLFSIYSYDRINQMWKEGNPFAWHLFYESKLVYADDNVDFIHQKGQPNNYTKVNSDCLKFHNLFKEAAKSLIQSTESEIFDLSVIFLSIRDIATCFSFSKMTKPIFSRNAALMLGNDSLKMRTEAYDILERARILCTRGIGKYIEQNEIQEIKSEIKIIDNWMKQLISKAGDKNV